MTRPIKLYLLSFGVPVARINSLRKWLCFPARDSSEYSWNQISCGIDSIPAIHSKRGSNCHNKKSDSNWKKSFSWCTVPFINERKYGSNQYGGTRYLKENDVIMLTTCNDDEEKDEVFRPRHPRHPLHPLHPLHPRHPIHPRHPSTPATPPPLHLSIFLFFISLYFYSKYLKNI